MLKVSHLVLSAAISCSAGWPSNALYGKSPAEQERSQVLCSLQQVAGGGRGGGVGASDLC